MLEAFQVPGVREVEGITAESFVRDILPANQPVLFRGLVKAWPSVRLGLQSPDAIADYLKALDTGAPTLVLEASPAVQGRFAYGADMRDFNFNKRTRTVSAGIDQLLNLMDHLHPPYVYIQSAPIPDYLPRFTAENPNPLLPPQIFPRAWISNATRAQTHNDHDHNIACVAAGRRIFTLFPPEQLVNLYIGPHDHTPSGRAISLASLEEPDFDTFPRLKEAIAHAQVAEMEPGDAIYIPKNWWHHVQALDAFNVLINYWWGNSPNTVENRWRPFFRA
ncbi:MAG: cupin-like domain-containing protein [Asticcacaulis sp.]